MKLGVMGAGLGALGWDKALDYCKHVGLDAIELPVGAYPGTPFFSPAEALSSSTMQQKIRDDVRSRGLEIIGLAVHGNPVSPDPAVRAAHVRDHDTAVRLAAKLGTDVVINFSGCPGGSAADRTPNWVTSAWPNEFRDILHYQWEDVLLPFWSGKAREAANEGVKIAFEAHPGFTAYNPDTLLKLRAVGAPLSKSCTGGPAVSSNLGANLDPSHFFWQGIDPIEAARMLGDAGAIFHVHGKDTGIDPHNTRCNGVLDTRSYGEIGQRSWVFRACGFGHGDEFWKPFISMLRIKGYDGVISIEHEDGTMSLQEGFEKAVTYLRGVLIRETATAAWWY